MDRWIHGEIYKYIERYPMIWNDTARYRKISKDIQRYRRKYKDDIERYWKDLDPFRFIDIR